MVLGLVSNTKTALTLDIPIKVEPGTEKNLLVGH